MTIDVTIKPGDGGYYTYVKYGKHSQTHLGPVPYHYQAQDIASFILSLVQNLRPAYVVSSNLVIRTQHEEAL